jgi:hypothetical protein
VREREEGAEKREGTPQRRNSHGIRKRKYKKGIFVFLLLFWGRKRLK